MLKNSPKIIPEAGIAQNNKNVVSLDGSRIMGVDGKRPRVEIEITALGGGGR